MHTFKELGLNASICKAIDLQGFSEPSTVQCEAMPQILLDKDLIVSAKTGTGKTASFILPMLQKFMDDSKSNQLTRGLILAPTRELAIQIHKQFQLFAKFTSIKSSLIIGGEPFKYQVASVRRNPEVFIATPGRLVEHIEKGSVDFSSLEMLVLDEADLMLDMGFSEDMQTVISACNEHRQIMLFSATLKHKSFARIRSHLRSPVVFRDEETSHDNDSIMQQRILADDDVHKQNILISLLQEHPEYTTMVFCNTRSQVQKVSNILQSKKIKSAYLHGELSQSDRKQILNRFRDGKLSVLVASDVAARGIDVADINLVVNFTVAHTGDDHTHRVGRTARAGSKGRAITLVCALEWDRMSSIERYLGVRLRPLKIPGLEAKYTGPKKLKSSGKAAGTKKKNKVNSKSGAKPGKHDKNKASKKTKNKPAKVLGDGSMPFKKKAVN